jgi:hypothetical protein
MINSYQKEIFMKTQWVLRELIFGIIFFMVSCQSDRNKKTDSLAPNAHQVTAREVIQTSSYTYVLVTADGRDYWIAINKAEVTEGETYYWSEGVAMRDFPSKELNRTFPTIFLVQDFSAQPITLDNLTPPSPMAGSQRTPQKNGIIVTPAEGGITIGELFSNRDLFDGKTVKIRGEVVKFASGIMNKNWIHIQDGTKDGDNYDVTITSQNFVKVGDVVVFKGIISLNKDFGAGYLYEVIMEDARLINEEK